MHTACCRLIALIRDIDAVPRQECSSLIKIFHSEDSPTVMSKRNWGNPVTDRTMLRRPANIDRAGYMAAEPADLTADRLTGARVYGANGEDIGEVDELLSSEDGTTVDKLVVDVGGFLGMGEREVAVTMEELHIMRSDDGMDFRVYMEATQEELEAQPEYEG